MATLANSHSCANRFSYFSSWKSTHNGENWTQFLRSQEFLKPFLPSHIPHRKLLHKIFCSFFLGSSLHTPSAGKYCCWFSEPRHILVVSWTRFLCAIPPASFCPLDVIIPIVAEMPLKHAKQSDCRLAHWFWTFFLLSLHLVPAEGHFSCGIPTLGTWRGCRKQRAMGLVFTLSSVYSSLHTSG